MEKDAFEYLSNQAITAAGKKVITSDNGDTFITEDMLEWHRDNRAKEILHTHTLSSVVDYLRSGADARDHLFIHVCSPTKVELLGDLNEYGEREKLIVSNFANDTFNFGNWYDAEELNIYLQSQFTNAGDRGALLQFTGSLTESNSNTLADDGVSQTASVKTGIASVGKAMVPNPVTLSPYRTFPEVEQPASTFIFRVREGLEGSLFEADNGAWKNEAIKNIKNYFAEAHFSNKITILA